MDDRRGMLVLEPGPPPRRLVLSAVWAAENLGLGGAKLLIL